MAPFFTRAEFEGQGYPPIYFISSSQEAMVLVDTRFLLTRAGV